MFRAAGQPRSPPSDETSTDPNLASENVLRLGFRILVPCRLAGCIIGRSGATIKSLQKRVNVTVKLSKPCEFHPGTCDRVALLIGERAGVAQAAHDIVLMLETGQDNYGSSERRMLPGDAIVCLRTLLPAAAGGALVNPHSEALRQLCAETKCHINLARQLRYEAATDRLCTISGTLSSVHAAVTGILMHLVSNADDAQHQALLKSYMQFNPYAGRTHSSFTYNHAATGYTASSQPQGSQRYRQSGFCPFDDSLREVQNLGQTVAYYPRYTIQSGYLPMETQGVSEQPAYPNYTGRY